MDDEQGAGSEYAKRVGARLRAVRQQRGFSLQDVEQVSTQEFKASVLGAYERGERAISVPRLQRLARCYGVPVDRLLPEGAELVDLTLASERERTTTGEILTIDLARLGDVNDPELDVLARYVTMIQLQRQDFNGRMLTIRRDDVRMLAAMMSMTPEGLCRRLDDLGLRFVS
jgi:transcriptional regulator with XRE-family HTH domain